MKKIKLSLIVLIGFLIVSCTSLFGPSKIVRWLDKEPELVNSLYELNNGENIFNDFLWTNPNIDSRELQFDNNIANVTLNNKEYIIEKSEDTLKITNIENNIEFISSEMESNNKYYYDIQELNVKTEYHQRWVPKTVIEIQTVPVQKTRQVPETKVGMDGMVSTSFRTEFYTDFETRHVPVTKWEWERYLTSAVEIPNYKYYQMYIDDEEKYNIYKIEKNNEIKYYIQNIAYRYLVLNSDNLFGNHDIKLLFVDSNTNGKYFDNDDIVFFNSWNPYEKNSKYASVKGLIENKWYKKGFIERNKMISFSVDENNNTISIKNLNAEYINNKKTGKLKIFNLSNPDAKLYLNGNSYPITGLFGTIKKEFKCEYGKYILKISNPGYNDFEEFIEINEDNKIVEIEYREPEKSGILKIENIFSDNFSVTISSNEYEEKVYSNQTLLSIPEGECNIEIYYDGFIFRKKIVVNSLSEIILDFENEIKNL